MKESTIEGLSWGVALFAVTIIIVQFLDYHQSIEFFSLIMAVIGSIYVGFALKEHNLRNRVIEIVSAMLFIVAALAGLWVSPWFIVAALILHGFWDLLHHNKSKLTKIPEWYIPLCCVYDWAAGGYLSYYLLLTH